MSKEKDIVVVLWNDHYESSLYEMIDYLKECEELKKEEIIGMEVEFCEEASVYNDEDYYKMKEGIEEIIGFSALR